MRHEGTGWTFLVAEALLLCFAAGVAGQTPEPAPREPRQGIVVSVGVGVGSEDFAGQASLWVQKDRHAFGLRTAGTSEFTIFSPPESAEDVALLYGARWEGRKGWGRLAAGPSMVWVRRPGEAVACEWFLCSYEEDRARSVGLAFQADAVWAFSRPLGIGLTVFGDVNPESTFVGLTLGLFVGNVGG